LGDVTEPPNSTVSEPTVELSNEEIVRVTNKLLLEGELDLQCCKILEELASSNPAIAENMECLSRESRDLPFIALIYKEPGECQWSARFQLHET